MGIVIAIAPGHEEDSDGSNNLFYDSFNVFLGWHIDGRQCIFRRTLRGNTILSPFPNMLLVHIL